jgi:hypothetical protein
VLNTSRSEADEQQTNSEEQAEESGE